jgi:hypothetical protein
MGVSKRLTDDKLIDSPETKVLDVVYEPSIMSTLENHNWGFARKTVALVEDEDKTHISWDYVYAYPEDCLKIILVTSEASAPTRNEVSVPFETETIDDDRFILTNEADAYIVYTSNVMDENKFPPSFVDAVSYRLAAELAMALAGDGSKQSNLMQLSMMFREESKGSQSSESMTVAYDRDSRYTRARQ